MVAGIASILIVDGCATRPDLTPVENYNNRMEFNGFSVLPPSGADWYTVDVKRLTGDRNPTVYFVKKDGDLSYVADGKLTDLGEVGDVQTADELKDLKKLMLALKDTQLFREGPRQANMSLTFSVEDNLGVPCVRFDMEAEDTQVPGRPGETFKLDSHGYYCPHPTAEHVLLHIFYSRRAPQLKSYIAGKEEGERFVQSVKFTSFRR